MVKNITTILINSSTANKTGDDAKNYIFNFNVSPIEIKSRAILKVANFTHFGTDTNHNLNLYNFKIKGINVDNSKFHYNINGDPVILSTTFDNSRSLYEENEITLNKQTINNIDIIVETIVPTAYISDLKIANVGIGYTSATSYGLIFSGGGTGIGATGIGYIGMGTSSFSRVSITNQGSLYTAVPTISIANPGTGSGASIIPTLNYGTTTAGISTKLNFCITLRIEQEEYE